MGIRKQRNVKVMVTQLDKRIFDENHTDTYHKNRNHNFNNLLVSVIQFYTYFNGRKYLI